MKVSVPRSKESQGQPLFQQSMSASAARSQEPAEGGKQLAWVRLFQKSPPRASYLFLFSKRA